MARAFTAAVFVGTTLGDLTATHPPRGMAAWPIMGFLASVCRFGRSLASRQRRIGQSRRAAHDRVKALSEQDHFNFLISGLVQLLVLTYCRDGIMALFRIAPWAYTLRT